MKKKIFLMLALALMLTCLFAIGASAETPAMYVQFDVLLDGNTEYTTAYVQNTNGSNPNVNLTLDFYSDKDFTAKITKSDIVAMDFSQASTYGDTAGCVKSFTTAGSSVFPKCGEIKWFNVGLTSMPGKAFKEWKQLKSFDLGCTKTIGDESFQNCSSLESIVIPESVTSIGTNAFSNCTGLNSVTYEGTPQVKTIGGGAFQNVPASNLTLPSSLEKITGQKAFAGSGIQTVVIPAGCTDLSTYTFTESKVTSVSFEEGFTGPFAFSVGVFQTCTQLTSVELAEGVTVIGQNCFNGAPIVTFVLPDSVTEIKGSAFANCKKLTTFTINPTSKLETLGSQVFKDGISLTSFYFPNSLTSIGSGLFIYNNGSLKELINFENCGVTFIPDNTFRQCSGLKEIKFPYGVTEINGKDLLVWANLDSITLPQTLKTITNPINVGSIGKIIFAAPEGTPLPANAPNVTVEYVNYCDEYFGGEHAMSGNSTIQFNGFFKEITFADVCTREGCGNTVIDESKTIGAIFTWKGFSVSKFADANGCYSVTQGFYVDMEAIKAYAAI
ncbi:MAG: leucine-rich repeat domain-containing protein, partial [Clostridia bacterium]|nr:leucine-rich repeat domain-containing protein [Clostridia bacterium]